MESFIPNLRRRYRHWRLRRAGKVPWQGDGRQFGDILTPGSTTSYVCGECGRSVEINWKHNPNCEIGCPDCNDWNSYLVNVMMPTKPDAQPDLSDPQELFDQLGLEELQDSNREQ